MLISISKACPMWWFCFEHFGIRFGWTLRRFLCYLIRLTLSYFSVLRGPGIESEHCILESIEGHVTLHPLAEECCVNGNKMKKSIRLTQGIYKRHYHLQFRQANYSFDWHIAREIIASSNWMGFWSDHVFHMDFCKLILYKILYTILYPVF